MAGEIAQNHPISGVSLGLTFHCKGPSARVGLLLGRSRQAANGRWLARLALALDLRHGQPCAMLRSAGFASIALAICLAVQVSASEIYGRVVRIADGDSFTILDADRRQTKVRLSGIDAPEASQPFGQKSKQRLSSLIAGKDVHVHVENLDRYGRSVGRVDVEGNDVCLMMVLDGYAWWYRSYAMRAVDLEAAESEARAVRRGLWVDPQPVAPWVFRRNAAEERKR